MSQVSFEQIENALSYQHYTQPKKTNRLKYIQVVVGIIVVVVIIVILIVLLTFSGFYPTLSPTKSPTLSPTKAPTKSPTKSPTPYSYIYLEPNCEQIHANKHFRLADSDNPPYNSNVNTKQECGIRCSELTDCGGFGFLKNIGEKSSCNFQKYAYCELNTDWEWYSLPSYKYLGANCENPHNTEQKYISISADPPYSEPVNTFKICAQKCFDLINCGGFGFGTGYSWGENCNNEQCDLSKCNFQETPFCDFNPTWDWHSMNNRKVL